MDAVDPGALGAWLAAHVEGASGGLRVDQLAGGASNLTFRVREDVHAWGVRSPPARRGTDVPVPRTVAFCGDTSVIGRPFYLMDRLDGIVFAVADDVAHLTAGQ